MRCPECSQRNSVAARVCSSCGCKFPFKPLPYQAKVMLGFLGAVVVVWFVAYSLLPQFMDANVILANAAQALAKGSRSPSDYDHLFSDFEKALSRFLDERGKLPNRELASELEKILPSALFEPHVFDLRPGLKLVEVAAGLKVSDFLVLTEGSASKVVPAPNLGVFDESSIIDDTTGSNLVLVGHLSEELTHTPTIKVFSVLPGDLVDVTLKAQPIRLAAGKANISKNKKDIQTALSLGGLAQAEHLFHLDPASSTIMPDETVSCSLIWNNGRYVEQWQTGKGPLFTSYALVKSLQVPTGNRRYALNLSKKAHIAFAKLSQTAIEPEPDFTLHAWISEPPSKKGEKAKVIHLTLKNAKSNFNVALIKSIPGSANKGSANKGIWIVDSLDNNQQSSAAPAQTLAKNTDDAKTTSTTASTTTNSTKAPPAVKQKPTIQAIASAITGGTTIVPHKVPTKVEKPKVKEPEKVAAPSKKEEVVDTSAQPEESSASPASSGISSGTITLRRGPGIAYPSLTTMSKGSSLVIIGKKNSWYRVRAGGKEGYVYAGLVDSNKENAYKTATVKRKRPIIDAAHHSLATAQPGEHLVILAPAKNDKYKVQLANGKIGYVAKDALEGSPAPASVSPPPTEPPQFVP